jgi:hypothetical protein
MKESKRALLRRKALASRDPNKIMLAFYRRATTALFYHTLNYETPQTHHFNTHSNTHKFSCVETKVYFSSSKTVAT